MSMFQELPPFIREYIHRNAWDSIRDIQEAAYEAVRDGGRDIVISSGTSSGKTEAAFIPVLTSLWSDPPEGIGALYISPLKALINDQYGRLSELLSESGVEVTGWHGDMGSNVKDRVKRDPKGVLQMTPESLQALIGNDPDSVRRMFRGLRFVIIDEMHAFMDSDRGLQLLCCLDRVERIASCRPVRIGLSATLYDGASTGEWISAGRDREVSVITGDSVPGRNVAVTCIRFPPSDSPDGKGPRDSAVASFYRMLFRLTDGHRCIVFANSRDTAEKVYRSLKKVSDVMGSGKEVYLHHGRVSPEMRRNIERALGSEERMVTVVSTSTLEMGIDIGGMDRIIQIDPPHGCSPLLQRMGRSGRRGNDQNMAVICREDDDRHLPHMIGRMNLIKAIAEVELAVDEGWCEPPEASVRPYGLLFHQTLEYLRPGIGARWTDLERDVLSQYPFRNIGREEYRRLLVHCIDTRILMMTDDRTILIGPEGERVAFAKDFHTVFRTVSETEIVHLGKIVGTIDHVPEMGDIVIIDGSAWRIVYVEPGGRRAEAEPSDKTRATGTRGTVPDIHRRVMERMILILSEDGHDGYLSGSARPMLYEARELYGNADGFRATESGWRIFMWKGSKRFRTVRLMLENMEGVKVLRYFEPYVMEIATDMSAESISDRISYMDEADPERILDLNNYDLCSGKYDRFVPRDLLKKA
ncbi:MAG: DEAD/DEAH box helicase, partial [Candidatus Methanomethylophilaceae archaeon]